MAPEIAALQQMTRWATSGKAQIMRSTQDLPIPKIKARLADLGFTASASSPADFGKLIAEDTENGPR
jgi:hypothetical protein